MQVFEMCKSVVTWKKKREKKHVQRQYVTQAHHNVASLCWLHQTDVMGNLFSEVGGGPKRWMECGGVVQELTTLN